MSQALSNGMMHDASDNFELSIRPNRQIEHIFYYWDETLSIAEEDGEENELGGNINFTIVQNIALQKTYFFNGDDKSEGFRLI